MRRVTNTNLFSSKALAELLRQENIPLRSQPDSKSPGAVENLHLCLDEDMLSKK